MSSDIIFKEIWYVYIFFKWKFEYKRNENLVSRFGVKGKTAYIEEHKYLCFTM